MRAFCFLIVTACFSSAPVARAPCPSAVATTTSPAGEPAGEPADEPADDRPADALGALEVVERCALASLLARQLVELMEWMHDFDKFTPNDRAVLVVFTEGTKRKLLPDAERCAPTEVRLIRRSPRRVHVEHAGTEIVGTPHLMLSLASDRSSVSRRRFTFTWSLDTEYRGNAPALPGQPSVHIGPASVGAPAPTIEIEVERRGDTLEVRRFEVVMWRRSGDAS